MQVNNFVQGAMEEDQAVFSELTLEEQQEVEIIQLHKTDLLDDIQKLKMEIAEVITELENFSQVEESKIAERNKLMAMGRKKFNMDPQKGIEFLIQNKLLCQNEEDIANFLHKGEGLHKTAIGDYLGGRELLNVRILQSFVELHEFVDLNLVQALRQFLWSFRLPGEAQKIDRMMEAFATRYCQCNQDVFQSTDTCYVLSFAIIMLNTSLHNPNVKEKPTLERFVAMNRGINNGGDLPPKLLKDKEPRGIIPLENLCVKATEDSRKLNCFDLYSPNSKGHTIKACKTEADGRVVEGNHHFYRISAPSTEERDGWIKSIRASITRDPFYDMVAARKRKLTNNKVN
ncbi:cytohesin-3-like isoform X3 [Narcine bancroftii]|uniref:cytohesin-3-like isoform X3 n=1 Tax=Narcine bancroftii TaxID=1343680 RepID=UPI003831ABB6